MFSPGLTLDKRSVAQGLWGYFGNLEHVTAISHTSTMKPQKESLAQTHPALAKEVTGWDPESFTAGSNTQVDWKCTQGHEFKMSIKNRTLQGYGCPICSGKRILPGFNDLGTLFPLIAAEAIDCDPTNVAAGSKKKLEWKCSKGHRWSASVGNRTANGSGCPFCANKQVLKAYNDLGTLFPDIASQADGWDPSEILSGAKKKLKWKCDKGHYWTADVGSRTSRNLGCPICSNRQLAPGINDLAVSHPKIAKQADGWNPSEFSAGSKKKMKWMCGEGHKFESSIAQRTTRSEGCPICSNVRLLPGRNDLATTHPDIAKEADGWDPTQVFAGTHLKLAWKCTKGHKWLAIGSNRTGLKSGCPICTNKVVQKGFNDLQTTNPKIASEADGWDPSTVTEGSKSKQAWKCHLGHKWIAVVSSRAVNGRGCPYCTNNKVLPGFNDLATKFPELAKQAVGWDPSNYLPGTRTKMLWRCENGHEWKAVITNRSSSSAGCPTCSVGGFDPNKPGWLYLLKHENWELLQIGISNVIEDRLQTHKYAGWEVLDVRGPIPGDATYGWEQSILKFLHLRGAQFATPDIAGKFSGYTEAWIEDSFSVETIKELMDLVHEGEQNY